MKEAGGWVRLLCPLSFKAPLRDMKFMARVYHKGPDDQLPMVLDCHPLETNPDKVVMPHLNNPAYLDTLTLAFLP